MFEHSRNGIHFISNFSFYLLYSLGCKCKLVLIMLDQIKSFRGLPTNISLFFSFFFFLLLVFKYTCFLLVESQRIDGQIEVMEETLHRKASKHRGERKGVLGRSEE